ADGLCVALGQLPLDAGDLAAAAENGPEAVVERGVIGLAQPDAAADRGPAVGLHKRGVDAVAGRAAHQAEGEKPIFAGHGRRNRRGKGARSLSARRQLFNRGGRWQQVGREKDIEWRVPLQSESLREIAARGFMHQSTALAKLAARAARKTTTAYIGFDATADS